MVRNIFYVESTCQMPVSQILTRFVYISIQILQKMHDNKLGHLIGPQQFQQLLTKIKPTVCLPKTYKADPDRLVYSQLLEFATKHLQNLNKDTKNEQKCQRSKLEQFAANFFNPLFQQIIDLSKRQCSEKASLLKMVYDFYRQTILLVQNQYEDRAKNFIALYTNKLSQKEAEFKKQKQQLSQKLSKIDEQNQNKWKTFYMIVRDNRVLRRQKGKLMRAVHDQRMKTIKIHEEMVLLAKQNQKNKLLANYQQQQSLQMFLRNQMALNKMQQYMKEYPKYEKRILLFNLKQLEILEEKALDFKIDYILKAARQTEEIFDQYEDLVDISPQNKILFNAAVQTDANEGQEMIESEKQIKKVVKTTFAYAQTTIRSLSFDTQKISLCLYHCSNGKGKSKSRRDITVEAELKKIREVAHEFHKQKLQIEKRVYSMRFYQKFSTMKKLELCSMTINQNFAIQYDQQYLPRKTLQKINSRKSRQLYSRGSIFMKKELTQGEKAVDNKKYRNSIQTKGLLQQFEEEGENKKLMISIKRSSTTKLRYSKMVVQTQPAQKKELKEFKDNQINSVQKTDNELLRESNSTSMNFLRSQKKTQLASQPGKKQNNDLSRKNGQKKKTMFRLSGFAANSSSSKKSVPHQQSRQTMKLSTPGLDSRNSQAGFSFTKIMENQNLPSANNLSTGNQRSIRQTINQKHINILGQQYSKVVEKVLKAIFLKRNEIAEGKVTFQFFLKEHMINQYGPQIKIFFTSKIIPRSDFQNPLVKAFDLLLSHYQTPFHLKFIFGLFGKLLILNNTANIFIDQEKGIALKNELLKNTLGAQFSIQQYSSKDCDNLCSIFLTLQEKVRRMVKNCELFQFLQQILPQSQKTLSFQEIRQILSVFIGQKQHLQYLVIMRNYCKLQMTPLLFCVYSFREKWTRLTNFKTTIETKYKRCFGEFSMQFISNMSQRLKRSEKLSWSYNLFKSQIQGEGKKRDILKLKYLSILTMHNQLQKDLPISSYLCEIQNVSLTSNARKKQLITSRNL